MNKRFVRLDDMIRQGRGQEAISEIVELGEKRLPREDRVYLANLARRVGHSELSLKWLNRIVRGEASRSKTVATRDEKIEYAAALIQVGVIREARKLLETIDTVDADVLLQFAFTHFREWNYREARIVLDRALKFAGLPKYTRLILNSNYAACLVHLDLRSEYAELLPTLLKETNSDVYKRLNLSVMQLVAEGAIQRQDWAQAESYLKKIEMAHEQESALLQLYVRRWRWVLKAERGGIERRVLLTELNALKREAQRLGDFETLRDLERRRARLTANENLFRKVYRGTPHAAYRKDLEIEFKKQFGKELGLQLNMALHLKGYAKDLRSVSTRIASSKLSLKYGQKLHRALRALLDDFYNPPSLASFHDKVFEESYYNPLSSPNRVHQLLRRLRRELESLKLPLEIEVKGKLIYLRAARPIEIAIESESQRQPSSRLLTIRIHFGEEDFKVNDAAKVLGVSSRTAFRVIEEGVELSLLRSIGNGRRRRYLFSVHVGHGPPVIV